MGENCSQRGEVTGYRIDTSRSFRVHLHAFINLLLPLAKARPLATPMQQERTYGDAALTELVNIRAAAGDPLHIVFDCGTGQPGRNSPRPDSASR